MQIVFEMPRLLAQGIVGSGAGFTLMSWCIQVRGPLYVSMFSPLLLVIVAVVGWAILGDKIRLGRYSVHLHCTAS